MEYGTFQEYQARLPGGKCCHDLPRGTHLRLFQGKWAIRVLFELSKTDTVRFGALKQRVEGITNTMLTSTLRQLEENGLDSPGTVQRGAAPRGIRPHRGGAGISTPSSLRSAGGGSGTCRRRAGWAPERFVPVRDSGEPAPYSGRMPPRRCGGTTAPPPG